MPICAEPTTPTPPERRAGPRAALPKAQHHAPETQQRQRRQRPAAAPPRQKIARAAQQTAEHADDHDGFRPPEIGVTPGMRTAYQRGDILQADNKPRPERAKSHHIMDIAWQYRQRQADSQKGSEVEDNDRDDFQVQPQAA